MTKRSLWWSTSRIVLVTLLVACGTRGGQGEAGAENGEPHAGDEVTGELGAPHARDAGHEEGADAAPAIDAQPPVDSATAAPCALVWSADANKDGLGAFEGIEAA